MNQADLRQMAEERIKDARALIRGKRWEFAYYAADERTIATNPVILTTLAEQALSMAHETFRARHPVATIEHQENLAWPTEST